VQIDQTSLLGPHLPIHRTTFGDFREFSDSLSTHLGE
jgi:hypothetical protein